MRKVLFKHSLSEGRDSSIEWMADFGKMEIRIYVSFISTVMLIDCLSHMARHDERFQLARIIDPLNMSKRFNIMLCVDHGNSEVWYKLVAYKFHTGNEGLDRLEIELTGTPR